MTASFLAKTAYSSAEQPVRTARDTEYEIFARVTRRLKLANGEGDFSVLASAVHENRTLWKMLGADVSLPENGLPQELRGRILYLAEFTRQHSSKILRGMATVDVLVEINTAMMRGLRMGAEAK